VGEGAAEHVFQRIAGGADVSGVGGGSQDVAEDFDVLIGDAAELTEQRFVAVLQGVAGMDGAGVALVGGESAQLLMKVDLQAE
jgi:hypothetical protein